MAAQRPPNRRPRGCHRPGRRWRGLAARGLALWLLLVSCAPVPYVTEAGTARLLTDLAQAEPRLAGRQPNEWIDSRFLREVEAEPLSR
jgi:hypothetical protein